MNESRKGFQIKSPNGRKICRKKFSKESHEEYLQEALQKSREEFRMEYLHESMTETQSKFLQKSKQKSRNNYMRNLFGRYLWVSLKIYLIGIPKKKKIGRILVKTPRRIPGEIPKGVSEIHEGMAEGNWEKSLTSATLLGTPTGISEERIPKWMKHKTYMKPRKNKRRNLGRSFKLKPGKTPLRNPGKNQSRNPRRHS